MGSFFRIDSPLFPFKEVQSLPWLQHNKWQVYRILLGMIARSKKLKCRLLSRIIDITKA